MAQNTKPLLTVLMEKNKLQQLRDYAADKSVSMGWMINRLVDRVLAGELDIMADTSIASLERQPSIAPSIASIDTTVKASIDTYIASLGIDTSMGLTRDAIDTWLATAIDKHLYNLSITSSMNPIDTYIEQSDSSMSPIDIPIEATDDSSSMTAIEEAIDTNNSMNPIDTPIDTDNSMETIDTPIEDVYESKKPLAIGLN